MIQGRIPQKIHRQFSKLGSLLRSPIQYGTLIKGTLVWRTTHIDPLQYPYRNAIETLLDPFKGPRKRDPSLENYPPAVDDINPALP